VFASARWTVPFINSLESPQMSPTSSAARHQSADRAPSRGGVLDGRTLVARRRRELIEIYTIAMGGPASLGPGQKIDVRKAAELTALAEAARARAMREGATGAGELTAMVRLEGMAARAVRALNIKPQTAQPKPSLADYVASKRAEAAGKPVGDPA
jgi:hypothetical protein